MREGQTLVIGAVLAIVISTPVVGIAERGNPSEVLNIPGGVVFHVGEDLAIEVSEARIHGTFALAPGATLTIEAAGPIELHGSILSGAFERAMHVSQMDLGSVIVYRGADGSDAGDIVLRGTEVVLAAGSQVATAPGQAGADVMALRPLNEADTALGIAGNGGSGGDLIVDARAVVIEGTVQLGSGGSGGDAFVRGLPGTRARVHGMNATAIGGDGAPHGDLIVNGQAASAPSGPSGAIGPALPRSGNGGNATAIGGNGFSFKDLIADLAPETFTLLFCGQNGVQGTSDTDVGQDGTGEDATAVAGSGTNGDVGCHASSPGASGGTAGDGGDGGDAQAFGGDGSNSCCFTGGDGGDADATGGQGGLGGAFGGNGADGADGAHGTTENPAGGDGQDGGNGGFAGGGGNGGLARAHGGDGGTGPFDDGTGGSVVADGASGGGGGAGGTGAAGGDAGCGLPGFPDGSPGNGGLGRSGGLGGSKSVLDAQPGTGDPNGTSTTSNGSNGSNGGPGGDGLDGQPC